MKAILATVDVTVRKTINLDLNIPEDVAPSRVAQIIQEAAVGSEDEVVAYHSVAWEVLDD